MIKMFKKIICNKQFKISPKQQKKSKKKIFIIKELSSQKLKILKKIIIFWN